MNEQEENIILIDKVTRSFYEKAINDTFIGYHFRKITSNKGPLSDIDDFNEHLKTINAFWYAQLLGIKFPKGGAHLLTAHEYLNIRKGELGRWIILFKQTLEEFRAENPKLINIWENKVDAFKLGFEKYFFEKPSNERT